MSAIHPEAMPHPVVTAARLVGGPSALARAVGVKPPVIHEWIKEGRPVPERRCVLIERASSGAVTRRDLRPFDWWLIWPELVTEEHPVPERSPATDTAGAQ